MKLTADIVRELLDYDPATGKLTWKPRDRKAWDTRYAGKQAFTSKTGYGYHQGSIFDKGYVAHRIIWLMVYGEWPKEQIDHINGDRADNRIENLRSVTHQENGKNVKRHSRNTSGFAGVDWNKSKQKWRGRINVGGEAIHLGYFNSRRRAAKVRKQAEIEHGFHENHGRA